MMCIFRCIYSSIFFFKQKTAYEVRISDWSSDVCSSDLCCPAPRAYHRNKARKGQGEPAILGDKFREADIRQAEDRLPIRRFRNDIISCCCVTSKPWTAPFRGG